MLFVENVCYQYHTLSKLAIATTRRKNIALREKLTFVIVFEIKISFVHSTFLVRNQYKSIINTCYSWSKYTLIGHLTINIKLRHRVFFKFFFIFMFFYVF